MIYKIKYIKEQKLNNIQLEASSIDELKSLKEFPTDIIDIKLKNPKVTLSFNKKIDLLPILKQLKVMLDAKLTISEAISLVLQNQPSKQITKILIIIENSIKNSITIENSLVKYKKDIPTIILFFLDLGIKNGDINQTIDSLITILQEDKLSKDSLKNSLKYPMILFGSLFLSIGMIFIYVIPNFEYIFSSMKTHLPVSTVILLQFKDIILEYYWIILATIVGSLFIIKAIYKKYQFFWDKVLVLNIPILSKVLRSYQFYTLFLALLTLVKSKYQFQTALQNSKDIASNLYIKKILDQIILDLKGGLSIYEAFNKTKLFDNLTLKLLFTAEQTSNYTTILDEIVKIHKNYFKQSIEKLNTAIEPLSVLIISLIVLWLILALMSPIWNLSNSL